MTNSAILRSVAKAKRELILSQNKSKISKNEQEINDFFHDITHRTGALGEIRITLTSDNASTLSAMTHSQTGQSSGHPENSERTDFLGLACKDLLELAIERKAYAFAAAIWDGRPNITKNFLEQFITDEKIRIAFISQVIPHCNDKIAMLKSLPPNLLGAYLENNDNGIMLQKLLMSQIECSNFKQVKFLLTNIPAQQLSRILALNQHEMFFRALTIGSTTSQEISASEDDITKFIESLGINQQTYGSDVLDFYRAKAIGYKNNQITQTRKNVYIFIASCYALQKSEDPGRYSSVLCEAIMKKNITAVNSLLSIQSSENYLKAIAYDDYQALRLAVNLAKVEQGTHSSTQEKVSVEILEALHYKSPESFEGLSIDNTCVLDDILPPSSTSTSQAKSDTSDGSTMRDRATTTHFHSFSFRRPPKTDTAAAPNEESITRNRAATLATRLQSFSLRKPPQDAFRPPV